MRPDAGQRLARVGCCHPHQFLVGEHRLGFVPEIGDLQLPQHIARPRRTPVRTDAQPHSGCFRAPDVRGRAVQPEVRERRPDQARVSGLHCGEVVAVQCRTVNSDQLWFHYPDLFEQLKLRAQFRIRPLGRMRDESASLLDRRRIRSQRFFAVGNQRADPDEVVMGAEFLGVDVPDQVVVRRYGAPRVALDRRRTADDRPGLDVPQQRATGRGAEQSSGLTDLRAVRRRPTPLIVRSPRHRARRLGPQRQAVVHQVIVQIDQSGIDETTGRDPWSVLETSRYGVDRGDRRNQSVVADIHRAMGENLPVRPHRHHSSTQYEHGCPPVESPCRPCSRE